MDAKRAVPRTHRTFATGKPRQAAALTSKAIATQKRQLVTSVLCATCWPLIVIGMVAILAAYGKTAYGALGGYGEGLKTKGTAPPQHVQCSRIPSFEPSVSPVDTIPLWRADAQYSFPLLDANGNPLPASAARNPDAGVEHVNWAQQPIVRDGSQYFVGLLRPCSYWYGENYPQNYTALSSSSPGTAYDLPTYAFGSGVRDDSNMDEPVKGWLKTLTNVKTLWIKGESGPRNLPSTETTIFFNALQQRSWFLVAAAPGVDASLLGTKSQSAKIPLDAYLKSDTSPLPYTPVGANATSGASGLLGSFATRYYLEFQPYTGSPPQPIVQGRAEPRPQPPANVTAVPWFVPASSQDAIDDAIAAAVTDAITQLATVDKTALSNVFMANEQFANLNIAAGRLFYNVPHGGLYFKK
eukprot:jgi/Hompol1/4420/HPOL_001741-RA